MRARTALIIGAVGIVVMFVFGRVMESRVDSWAERMTEVSATERSLAGIAIMWNHFWWIGAPVILALMLMISLITHKPSAQA